MDHNNHKHSEMEGHQNMDHEKHHDHSSHHAHMVEDFKKRFWISLIFTIPVLILSPLIQDFLGYEFEFRGDLALLFAFSSIIFFYGGYPFLKGFYDEISEKNPGMMTLIAVAITTAYLYSSAVVFGLSGKFFFWEIVTLIDIMLLGHWIEMKSVIGASEALEELTKLMPTVAHKIVNDKVQDVNLDDLKKEDIVLVKPGEKIPADGKVIEGETSVNEAMLTGESKPVSKSKDSNVIGGSINGEGSIKVEIQKAGKDSFFSQMVNLVKEAQESKSKAQTLADRAAKYLTIIALTAGAITLYLWLFIFDKNFVFSLERTVTVMVITCPHALGLAVPLVIAVSTVLAAKNGLLIRDRSSFESARNIQTIIFDKTGTLTKGEFGVSNILTFSDDIDEKEILKYAASVETNSEHSIAKAIVATSKETYSIEKFSSIPGKGAQSQVNGHNVKVVSPRYLEEKNQMIEDPKFKELSKQGKTVVFILIDDKVVGAIALADIIRDEAKEAISTLKKRGIQCMMVTGDNKNVAKWVADELGLDEYFAEVLPDKKAQKVKEVQSRGITVAMVGDGVNDAPALAQADVGIAIGAGTDVAIEAADIILVKNNPLDAALAIIFSQTTYNKIVQNLFWATGYNALAIPLAAGLLYNYGILLSPAVGAILMSLSTVIVAINAKFLNIKKHKVIL